MRDTLETRSLRIRLAMRARAIVGRDDARIDTLVAAIRTPHQAAIVLRTIRKVWWNSFSRA